MNAQSRNDDLKLRTLIAPLVGIGILFLIVLFIVPAFPFIWNNLRTIFIGLLGLVAAIFVLGMLSRFPGMLRRIVDWGSFTAWLRSLQSQSESPPDNPPSDGDGKDLDLDTNFTAETNKRPREKPSGQFAKILTGLLVAVMAGILAYALLLTSKVGNLTSDELITVIQVIGTSLLAPLVGLVGAVVGFYYGGQTAVQSAQTDTQAASQATEAASKATEAASKAVETATLTLSSRTAEQQLPREMSRPDGEKTPTLRTEIAQLQTEQAHLQTALQAERSKGLLRRLFGLRPPTAYDTESTPEARRELVRARVAFGLIGTLVVVVLGTIGYMAWLTTIKGITPEEVINLMRGLGTSLLAPLVGLVGAVVGFYYGGQTAVQSAQTDTQAASQATEAASKAVETATQAASESATQVATERASQRGTEEPSEESQEDR